MDVQTFILGFALIIVGLLFRQLVTLYYGWLVVAALSALFGLGAFGYLIGHSVGMGEATQLAESTIEAIKFPLGTPEINDLYLAVSAVPGKLVGNRLPFWPLLVSSLLAVSGVSAFLVLLQAHIARIRRAAEIGVEPKDIKVDFTFE